MMKIIQIVITFITLIGTVLAFIFTPQINPQIYFYKKSESESNSRRDKIKQRWFSFGIYLTLVSIIIQLALYFIYK